MATTTAMQVLHLAAQPLLASRPRGMTSAVTLSTIPTQTLSRMHRLTQSSAPLNSLVGQSMTVRFFLCNLLLAVILYCHRGCMLRVIFLSLLVPELTVSSRLSMHQSYTSSGSHLQSYCNAAPCTKPAAATSHVWFAGSQEYRMPFGEP